MPCPIKARQKDNYRVKFLSSPFTQSVKVFVSGGYFNYISFYKISQYLYFFRFAITNVAPNATDIISATTTESQMPSISKIRGRSITAAI